jgi:hypothetical protein
MQGMYDRAAARALLHLVLVIALVLAAGSLHAAVFDEQDLSRLTDINEAFQSFEDEVGAALHHVPQNDAEQIESYAYVKLNLEAAHERLNNVFMLLAVSVYAESPSDQFLILRLMYDQLLAQSKNYLNEKNDAIASMAAAHPANAVFAAYAARANATFGDRAIPFIDELYRRIGALRR